MSKPNYFATLNDALASEGLVEAWDIKMSPLYYGQTVSWTWQDGTRYGHYISIYRNEHGMYERPVHYSRG